MRAPASVKFRGEPSLQRGDCSPDLPRKVGFWGAIAILIGIVIGSGIFAAPTDIAKSLSSPPLILTFWIVGGLIALCGALTFAELAALLPRSGGIYVFLREGFGPCPAFVFGWTYMLITKPAAAGGIAVVFSSHFHTLTGWSINGPLLTCIALFILTLINVLGVRGSARLAIVLTSLKFAAIGAIIVLGVWVALRGDMSMQHFAGEPMSRGSLFRAIAPVMAAVMWTYDGWCDVGSIAGEVKNPGRTLPRVYLIGTLAVIVLYVLANAVYLWYLPISQIRQTDTVAPVLVTRLAGPIGMTAVTVLIILSTLGSSHASVMTGARVTFAQARDGLLFRFLGRVHPRYETPAVALWTQLALSCAMVLALKNFQSLANSFVFTMWIFYGLAAVSVFALRKSRRDEHRPFRVPGYPLVPVTFVLASLAMTVLGILDNPRRNAFWLAILAAGVPVYYIWRRLVPVRPEVS